MTLPRLIPALLATALLLLASCGGGRDAAIANGLQPPKAALVEPARCDEPERLRSGPIGLQRVGDECLRSFSGLDEAMPALAQARQRASGDARRRALAGPQAAPTRLATPTEIFDWAEQHFPQFFPGHRSNLALGPYIYRYYPESQIHLAVEGDKVYGQGPVTGGTLSLIATVADLTCAVNPSLCPAPTNADCAPPAQWASGLVACTPDQSNRVAHGASFTFTDTVGTTTGSATYTCSNGTLSVQGGIVCSQAAQLACNTNAISWTVGTSTCTPNANEPTQIAHGNTYTFTDSTGTAGKASYSCLNGTLGKFGTDTCSPPPPLFCTPTTALTWTDAGSCSPDEVPAQIADGADYLFLDSKGEFTGSKVFRCVAGALTPIPGGTCQSIPQILDSFGNPGGSADGGASGDGTAGDGAPIAGGLVRITDMNGRIIFTTTDSNGYFRVKLTGFTPPLVASVQRPDGKVRRSLSLQPLKINGYIFIAITGLTDKIASDVAQAAGFNGAGSLTPQIVNNFRPQITSALVALRNNSIVRPQLIAAGLNPDTFDPLATPFRANGQGYDRVLDNVVVDTDGQGGTIIKSANCEYTGPFSWTVGNNTCDTGVATQVIKTVESGSSITFTDDSGPTRGQALYFCQAGVLSGPITKTCNLQPAN